MRSITGNFDCILFADFIVYQHVNKDCNEPSEAEVELWKKGELDLYAQYTHIKLKVNSALLDVDMIRSLIEGSK